ncbi:hypothetical protein [Streptomyces sp. TLI_146]|uniref:hypothetical protein n=1 Tax=Streptomyces sp. TLI_146 TaxID=1938858 RepID=UPI000CAC9C98|nr:hypothetical protein [Streptomyces sp. TLI_146]PKV82789.1 hypothetical protein BX283_0246 [Streptomyces sp. TLI_146]
MDCSVLDLGRRAVRPAVRPLPPLTSRRHIDLLRVCSAASSSLGDGSTPVRA